MTDKRHGVGSGALLGLAVGDALGAPVEFKRRGSFKEVTDMIGGGYFRLPPGAWTDDTAMALCLAESLLESADLDPSDLLRRFIDWAGSGSNTSTGICVGIGQNTLRVLGNHHRTGALLAPETRQKSDGNGAIMRLAPVAIRHWSDLETARRIAVAQSRVTHFSEISAGCCDLLATILVRLINGQDWDDACALQGGDWPDEVRQIAAGHWRDKSRDQISSTGFAVHTLEAALWCVSTTNSFEAALIAAVNLGDDADTVGAVTGQLAGARYGLAEIPGRWLETLVQQDRIRDLAKQLFDACGKVRHQGGQANVG